MSIQLRNLIAGVIMVVSAVAAQLLIPHVLLADIRPVVLERLIPSQFGEWKMLPAASNVIQAKDVDAEISRVYDQVLTRSYADGQGHNIMLSVAYSRDQSDNSGKQVHRPEICYPAQGFNLHDAMSTQLTTPVGPIPVRRMVATMEQRTEPLTYWMTVGNHAVKSPFDFKVARMKYGLAGNVADGMIFRVSSIDGNTRTAYAYQQAFISQLMQSIDANSRHILGVNAQS